MTKITIEQENNPIKIQAELPNNAVLTDVFTAFHGMVISLGYQMGSIENAIKELAEEIKD